MILIKFFFVIFCLVESNADYIAEFGIDRGRPIETGFLFWEGKYIEAPYVVERRGLMIFVNGVAVTAAPPFHFYEVPKAVDPGPAHFKATDFLDDREVQDFLQAKWSYLQQQYDEEEAIRKMGEVYASLPFLDFQKDPDTGEWIVKEKATGRRRKVVLEIFERIAPYRKTDKLEWCNSEKTFYESTLREGSCLIWPRTGLTQLEKLLSLMRSSQPLKDKIGLLEERLGISGSAAEKLAAQFSASPQCEKRLKAELARLRRSRSLGKSDSQARDKRTSGGGEALGEKTEESHKFPVVLILFVLTFCIVLPLFVIVLLMKRRIHRSSNTSHK